MSAKRKVMPEIPDHLPPLTDEDGEVRELTEEDFRYFRPSSDFPEMVEAFKRAQESLRARGQRGPQRAPTKDRVTLRLDHDIVESYRADGPGWQTRINDDLARLQKRRKRA